MTRQQERLLDQSAPEFTALAQPQESPSIRDIMMGFESIGDNCEFGYVQRYCGADPLGLMRWLSAPFQALLAALRQRLEGFGELEHLDVKTSATGLYIIVEKAFDFQGHTFIPKQRMTAEAVKAQQSRRLKFLAERFVTDLNEPAKIFLYRNRREPLESARVLHGLLREYGCAALLWISPPDETQRTGEVYELDEGLALGTVENLNPFTAAPARIPLDTWIMVCRKASSVFARRATKGTTINAAPFVSPKRNRNGEVEVTFDWAESARRASRLEPSSADLHVCCGNALLDASQFAEAELEFRAALAVAPAMDAAFGGLGLALMHQGDLDRSIDAFREAIKRNPASARFHHQLGRTLARCEEWVEAEEAFRSAIAIERWNANLYFEYSTLLGRLNRAEQAREAMLKAAELRPDYKPYRSRLAEFGREHQT